MFIFVSVSSFGAGNVYTMGCEGVRHKSPKHVVPTAVSLFNIQYYSLVIYECKNSCRITDNQKWLECVSMKLFIE